MLFCEKRQEKLHGLSWGNVLRETKFIFPEINFRDVVATFRYT